MFVYLLYSSSTSDVATGPDKGDIERVVVVSVALQQYCSMHRLLDMAQ